jgi:hypothetical protein
LLALLKLIAESAEYETGGLGGHLSQKARLFLRRPSKVA